MTAGTAVVPSALPAPARHRSQDVDGARLAIVEIGDPDRPAVVVAHGAGSSARFICAAFAHATYRCGLRLVTFDARGHGSSSPAREIAGHHLDTHAADLAAVASGTAGQLAAVGGVSLGAHAAVRAVSRGAVQSPAVLACLPAWTGRATSGEGPHAAVAAELRDIGVAGVLERLRGVVGLPAWLMETVVADFARHDTASLNAALLSLDGGKAPDEAELAALDVPLAVVGWSGDPAHPMEVAQRWAAAAGTATCATLRIADLDQGIGMLGEVAMAALQSARRAS